MLYEILVVLCPSANMESSVTLDWIHFQALVKMYAKDESKHTGMLKHPYPSQHLLEVVSISKSEDTILPGTYTV